MSAASMGRTQPAVRCAPLGRMHHLLSDALPIGWAVEQFGPDGARAVSPDRRQSIIVTRADHDGDEWVHASMAGQSRPSYDDLCGLHRAVFGDAYAYQCFVPQARHINIHEHALHLWGRADGVNVLPDFGAMGTI